MALLLGEFAVRTFRKEIFSTSNLIERALKINRGPRRGTPGDTELGWVNALESARIDSRLFTMKLGGPATRLSKVSTHQGVRENPNVWKNQLNEKYSILALGDSFTWGGEVSNEETWPTHLQALTKTKVINGGVSLYGLDQSLLRLKQILRSHAPQIVILSVIRESILRTQRKKQQLAGSLEWLERPYFIIKDGQLELQNVPVHQNEDRLPVKGLRQWLGRSHLSDLVFSRVAFDWWYGSNWLKPIPPAYLTGEDPKEVSCLILKSFLELSKQHHFHLVVLGQYYWEEPYEPLKSEALTQAVLQCSRDFGILTLDLEDKLHEIAKSSPEEYNTLYFPGTHMTNRGNWWVANEIASVLDLKSN